MEISATTIDAGWIDLPALAVEEIAGADGALHEALTPESSTAGAS